MSTKNERAIGMLSTIGSAVVAIHGITSKRWKTAHTVFVLAGVAAAVVAFS